MTEIERATPAAITPGTPAAVSFGRVLNGRRHRIGSRTSPMAMAQARQVGDLLTWQVDGLDIEIVGIQTTGDVWRGDLARLGGKAPS